MPADADCCARAYIVITLESREEELVQIAIEILKKKFHMVKRLQMANRQCMHG